MSPEIEEFARKTPDYVVRKPSPKRTDSSGAAVNVADSLSLKQELTTAKDGKEQTVRRSFPSQIQFLPKPSPPPIYIDDYSDFQKGTAKTSSNFHQSYHEPPR